MRTPELDDTELRVLDAISDGVVRGYELSRRSGVDDAKKLFDAVCHLIDLGLIEARPRVFDERLLRSAVFSVLPSRRQYARHALMSKS